MSQLGPIGIDLGTMNTCVCMKWRVASRFEFKVLDNKDGGNTTPSYVAFTDTDEIVGKYAKAQCTMIPQNVVYGAKRLLGRKRSDPKISEFFDKVPFKVLADAADDPVIEISRNGEVEKFRPEEISARVLGSVKGTVRNKTGKEMVEAVITVPAYFDDLQRQATMRAAQIAGISVVKLVNEPTAAAIAFQKENDFDHGKVLVYDFGGGTLDCSVLEVEGKKFTVKGVSGDPTLGGLDIDWLLADFVLELFKKKYPSSKPEENTKAMARLLLEIESVKCSLSASVSSDIVIPSFVDGHDLNERIRRAQLESALSVIQERLEAPIISLLKDAGLEKNDISYIILVGGSARIPFVRETITEFFDNRITPLEAVNPDEAVAVGAAIVCDIIKSGEAGFEDNIEIIDTLPMSIGIQENENDFKPFLIKNQPLPQSKKMTGVTTRKNQRYAKIRVYQGEDPIASNNTFLGEYKLSPLPKGNEGEVKFEITLEVDESGLLRVKAKSLSSPPVVIDVKVDVKSTLGVEKMTYVTEKYKRAETKEELKNKYNNLLNTMLKKINILKGKKVDPNKWILMYDNFSNFKPTTVEGLENSIENIEKLIENIEREIKDS